VRTPNLWAPSGPGTDTVNSLRVVSPATEKRMPVITPSAGVPRASSLRTRLIEGSIATAISVATS
jgi:hypothetical protein